MSRFVRSRAFPSGGRGSHAKLRSVRIAQPPQQFRCAVNRKRTKRYATFLYVRNNETYFDDTLVLVVVLGMTRTGSITGGWGCRVTMRSVRRKHASPCTIGLLLTRGVVARPCQSSGERLGRQMARRSFRSTLPALECPRRGACRRCRLSWSFFPRHDQVTGPRPFLDPTNRSLTANGHSRTDV